MEWAAALVLYAIPVLHGVRRFDDIVEECLEWMRSDMGEWYPPLAPLMTWIVIIGWPVAMVLDAFTPDDR